jgi:hypothetical protein
MKPDLFQSPDYYLLDDLLSEHKLVRDSACVGKSFTIIEEYAQKQNSQTNHQRLRQKVVSDLISL